MDAKSLIIELIVGFVALFLMTKILGKVSLAQITTFDFISSIVLGELVGNAIYDNNVKLNSILLSVAIWGLMIYIIEWFTQKFRGSRSFLEGKPSIIIRNGHIDREEMKKNKLDLDELQNLLRQRSVFSIREVAYAVLETDGSVNVLKKSKYDITKKSDLNVPQKPVYLPITLINDGEVDYENLKEAGLDENWLFNTLREHKIDNAKQVFYLEWKKDEGVFLEKM
ncbi:DUF421 domain-containing protein [Terrilactibacillus laevilacticus]|uniref:DUF421 domain-containing protein n=1 Tax=Terrilactibacillus laevilacticus TaxID=1380157 RepID=A0ABW5PN93_9BACI|nr:DUF421 domain-containing protein [Terrilactibacillus laevilacticus]